MHGELYKSGVEKKCRNWFTDALSRQWTVHPSVVISDTFRKSCICKLNISFDIPLLLLISGVSEIMTKWLLKHFHVKISRNAATKNNNLQVSGLGRQQDKTVYSKFQPAKLLISSPSVRKTQRRLFVSVLAASTVSPPPPPRSRHGWVCCVHWYNGLGMGEIVLLEFKLQSNV